jgi:CubicO group peptidase (beta-lactamase class C family)
VTNPHDLFSLNFKSRLLSLLIAVSATASVAQTTSSRLDLAALTQVARHQGVCVVSVAVIRGQEPAETAVAKGCEAGSDPPMQPTFQAASLSKPVFAYAVLKLAQQGRIQLDEPLATYLPQGYLHVQKGAEKGQAPLTDHVPAAFLHGVTARQLLQHTAGLPNWSDKPLALAFEPGTRWQYSGEGYVLLQRAVETISGMPLDAFMREQVFGPLGMAHSDYVWSERVSADLVAGTRARGEALPARPMLTPIAAYSLYTTAGDYARFVSALLRDRATLQQVMDAPVDVDPGLGLSWGLGWGIETTPNSQYLWHWGNNPGYRAFVMVSLISGDGVVMLTNGENGLAVAEPVVQTVLPGPHKTFQFSRIPSGMEHWVCRTFGLCF